MSAVDVAPPANGRRTTIGGIGYAVAGALQLIAVLRVLLPSVPDWITPGWQVVGWLLGGIVLVAASVVLATGRTGEPAIVGRSLPGRVALVVSGTGDLLLAAVAVLGFAIGPAAWSSTPVALIGSQLLVLAATTTAAVAVVRARAVTGAARWALVVLAAVDAAAVLVWLAPDLLPRVGPGTASLFVTVVVRPIVVLAVGTVLALRARP